MEREIHRLLFIFRTEYREEIIMYKIIFIDDEFLVLEGLKRIIDWSEYGITVAGSAKNALDGIKLAEEINPEIIISDIRMHGMNGLEMIEKIMQKGYGGYIVLLSGYQEFEYAQKAIENRVYRYLLKPIDIEELKKTISQIVGELDSKKSIPVNNGVVYDVIDYINGHFYENIQLSDLAGRFHFDITHLSRQIKQKLGMNYIDYVTKLRIDMAKDYIRETDMSFDEISRRVGYNDVRRFREMFRKRVNMTPTEYKKSIKSVEGIR